MGLLIGIDHGGTTTTALVLDEDGTAVARRSVPMPKRMPQPGWVEHNPDDFVRTSIDASRAALVAVNRTWRDVHAIGIANQGETSMVWSRQTGAAIGPALSWEDRRTADACDELVAAGWSPLVRERTGLMIDSYFSATKLRWLYEHAPGARAAAAAGSLCAGGSDTYLIHKLTRGEVHATDPSTASRTALLDLRTRRWDEELAAIFGVPPAALPEIRSTCGDFGVIDCSEVNAPSVRIAADVVDAHAALFAHGCWDQTVAKATYGTGGFIEANTGTEPIRRSSPLLAFVAWEIGGSTSYTVEGGVLNVGSAIDWLVATGIAPSAAACSDLAAEIPDSGGVDFVPCFGGLAAPHWVPRARACILGLGLDTQPAHIIRALLEGIALSVGEVIQSINVEVGGLIREVRADGGPSRNEFLMQCQADVLDRPVAVSTEPDMTALGAAYLAGIGSGHFTPNDVAGFRPSTRVFEPRMRSAHREALWERWNRALATARACSEGSRSQSL